MLRYLLIFVWGIFLWGISYAQPGTSEIKENAKVLFAKAKFEDALALLSGSNTLSREDKEARFLIALCHYQLNDLDASLNMITLLLKEEEIPYPESWLYLGKIYHARHQFKEATEHYKLYLRTIKSNHPNRRMVIEEIRRCATGLALQYSESPAIVDNVGTGVNSEYDEFAPVFSPSQGNKLYFSSIREGNIGGQRDEYGRPDERYGNYSSDIYSCHIIEGRWAGVKPMSHLLNSPQHEVLLDFKKDGSALYYFKGPQSDKGEILVDSFRIASERILSTDPFTGPVNTRMGDGTLYFANDTTLLFSSRRPGGYGGLDIYMTKWRNGRWSPPQNLGPVVNTSYDETTPFLARDGRTLYFSSNDSHKSMGGLDIFKSVYNHLSDRWTEPVNLGLPINSAADDAYFRLAIDGFTAAFSSSRKDGFGQRDLYFAYFKDFLPEQELPQAIANVIPKRNPPPKKEPTPIISEPEEATSAIADKAIFGLQMANPEVSFSKKDRKILDQIGLLLAQNPELNLIISSIKIEARDLKKELYISGLCAERIAKYFFERGIDPSSVFIRGTILDKGIRSGYLSEDKYQIDFSFAGIENSPNQEQLPVIGKRSTDPFSFLAINNELVYKVQVSSLKGPFQGSLNGYPSPMIEMDPTIDSFRYTLGAFTRFSEAKSFHKTLVRKGFNGSFIVAYINGVRANNSLIKKHLSNYPDLNHYLNQ